MTGNLAGFIFWCCKCTAVCWKGGILDMHIWDSAQLVLAENEAFFFFLSPPPKQPCLLVGNNIFHQAEAVVVVVGSAGFDTGDLPLQTCRFGQDSSLWFKTIIIRQLHHSHSGQTRWSWSESNWIAVRFELKSLWKVQTFFNPTQEVYDRWTGEGTTSAGQRSSKQSESGKHMKAVTFPSCCQRGWQMEWTLPADVQDTEQAPRSETSLVLVSLTHINTYLSHFSMKKWNNSGSKALLWHWQKDFWHSLACVSYRRSLGLLRRINRFAIRRPGFQRSLLLLWESPPKQRWDDHSTAAAFKWGRRPRQVSTLTPPF